MDSRMQGQDGVYRVVKQRHRWTRVSEAYRHPETLWAWRDPQRTPWARPVDTTLSLFRA